MKMLRLVVLLLYIGRITGILLHLDDVVYVSRFRGKAKSNLCGSKSLPCKTLQVGIDKLAWGGQLYIDGEHTQVDPYTCASSAGKLVVKKSLSIQSYTKEDAHISCENGFTISQTGTRMNVNITRVRFKNTVLYLKNVNVTFQNCAFIDSTPAIDVRNSKSLPSYSLNIKDSVFERNRGCIFFTQGQADNERSCSRIILKLAGVIIRANTAFTGDTGKGGLFLIKHSSCFCKDVSFLSIWENVTAIENQVFKYQNSPQTKVKPYLNKTRMKDPVNTQRKGIKRDSILNSLFVINTCSANITLNRVTSDNNTNMRFLGLQCCHSNVNIHNSGFHRHSIRGPGGVVYIPDGLFTGVSIKSSNFTGNNGSIGGVLQVDGRAEKRVLLRLSNVSFLYCSGSESGCTVSVGNIKKRGVDKAFVLLNGVLFNQCHNRLKHGSARNNYGPLCVQATSITKVKICDSIFRINKNLIASSVCIIHSPAHNNSRFYVQIVRTLFDQNTCNTKNSTLGIFIEKPTFVERSTLIISDSVFTRNKGRAIKIENVQDIKLLNFTCNYTKGLCYEFYIGKQEILKNVPPGLNATLRMENAIFSNNYQSLEIKYVQPDFVDIQLRNIMILDNGNTGASPARFQFGSKRLENLKITGKVLFERVYFISNIKYFVVEKRISHLFSVLVPKFHTGNVSFAFRHCVFRNNFHGMINSAQRNPEALFFFQMPEDEHRANTSSRGCSKFPSYNYRNNLKFEEVIFENNTGSCFIAYIANGQSFFNQCLFRDNYSHKPNIGAHLFIQEGTSSVEFRDTSFIQTKVKSTSLKRKHGVKVDSSSMLFVYAGARGPFVLRNSSFVANDSSERYIPHFTIQTEGYVHIDNLTRLMCPLGSYMHLDDGSHLIKQGSFTSCINITQLKFICKMCGVGKYSLERGSYQGKLRLITCFEFCPFGAECTWNIHSRPNFWGYQTLSNPPQLNFTRCPESYCRAPRSKANTSVYNRCSGNRTGMMCGTCKEGYTESMFNHKCRPISDCKDGWFWVIAGLYSVIMAIYIYFRPPIVMYLVKKAMWFRSKKTSIPNRGHGQTTTTDEHVGHGYSKIIFYFYQVADLLMLESSSEILKEQAFIFTVMSFYNFQVDVADSSFGCPFPGLTAVTKDLFRYLQVFVVIVILVAFYFLHWLLRAISKRSQPHFAPYLAAIIEVLLLGYERLAHTSLKLLNCAPLHIHGQVEWRLVLDGNITCWVHWWQYVMVAYNIFFVIPFVLVLLVGTSKLRCLRINALQFVAACFLPLPFLMYWMVERCLTRYSQNERRCHDQSTGVQERRKALLDVLQGPFRQPDSQSRGAFYWESVLIGRRFVLLCLYSFISTPMLRMLFMTTVCIAVLFHNITIRPYKDNKTHIFGVILLFAHVVLAIINLCISVLITVGLTPTGPTEKQIEGLQLFEVTLLGVMPFIFVLLVLVTLVSQSARFLVLASLYLIKRCKKTDETRLDINSRQDDYRPLINHNEQENSFSGAQEGNGLQ